MRAGRIQWAFAAKAKHILQRHNRKTRGRTLREPNQSPVRSVFARADQTDYCPAFFFIQSGPPTKRCIVIVRAGVNHVLAVDSMRQISMCARVAECEL